MIRPMTAKCDNCGEEVELIPHETLICALETFWDYLQKDDRFRDCSIGERIEILKFLMDIDTRFKISDDIAKQKMGMARFIQKGKKDNIRSMKSGSTSD